MKKMYLILLMALTAIYFSCGGADKKDEKPAVESKIDWSAWVKTSNTKLQEFPVAGFDYKSASVAPRKWEDWAKKAAPIVKEILNKVPDGHVLQVTGHTDARGPEEPVGKKPGNIKISTDRAKTVYNALAKEGIDSPKLTYKGVGSSDPVEGIDSKDERQRRVTFEVVKAEEKKAEEKK